MMLLVVTAFVLLARVESQCLTSDDDLPPPPQPDLAHITSFSLDLFKEVLPPSGNFFFSPYSLWTALVLTYFGANGNTQTQMEEVLRLTNETEAFALYKALNRGPQANNPNYTLATANKIYAREGEPLRECLQKVLSDEMQILDFTQSEAAANNVNEFVKNATRGEIQKAVNPSFFKNSVMVIVNAIYFKGLWEEPFFPGKTTKQEFFTASGQNSLVDMMVQTDYFRHGFSSDLDAQVLEMPYGGKNISMFVFLPEDNNTGAELDNMIHRLDATSLQSAMGNLDHFKVIVELPKFKYEHQMDEEIIISALQRMGIRDAFSASANFTSFSSAAELFISGVAHKAVIEVNEEGSKASAVSAIIFPTSAGKNFKCNRPFLFFIHDNVVNTILFMGTYRGP